MKTQTLQDREVLYRSLFDNTLDGLAYCQMIFDPQGHPVDFVYLEVNKNFEKLTGLKDAAGKKVTELIPGIRASNPELLEIYGRVALNGKPEKFETYLEPLDKWFLISVYSPQKKFFTAVFQNITDQKRIEKDLENAKIAAQNVLEDLQAERETLANAKAKDEAILASIGDGIIATGSDKRIFLMNKVAEKLLGWNIKEAIGKLYDDVVSMEDENGTFVPPKERPLAKAFAHSTTTTTTTRLYLLSKNKIKYPVTITVSPIILGNKIIGAIEVLRDITREMEIDKAKSEFVALASHQLRTPLTAIDGLTSMILDGEYGPINKNLKQPLEDVNTSSERLIRLVNDLLNLSRIQAGRLRYKTSNFSLSNEISQIVALLQPVAQKKRLELKATKLDNVTVQGDPDKLEQIFDNLIGNAFKFTDKGGITITTRVVDDKVEVYIIDTGIGIAKEDQAKLFGQFQQLESGAGRSIGTGLGLYISREMARKMGGELWIEKSEPGVGSTFAFSIPKAKSQLARRVKEEIEKEAKAHPDQKSDTIKQVKKV